MTVTGSFVLTLCCRALVLQRGFFPSLCLHEDDFLGNCENVVAWLDSWLASLSLSQARWWFLAS